MATRNALFPIIRDKSGLQFKKNIFFTGAIQQVYCELEDQRIQVRIPAMTINFSSLHNVQTGSRAQLASCMTGVGGGGSCFPRAEMARE
jgi:hypothetical protein